MKIQPGKRVQNMITGLIELRGELSPAIEQKMFDDIGEAIRALNKVEKGLNLLLEK